MSVRRPRAVGRLVKWVVIPVACVLVGVFVLGPVLSKTGIPFIDSYRPKPAAQPTATQEEDTPKTKFGEPEVEVSVSPVPRSSTRSGTRRSGSRRRRGHRRRSQPSTENLPSVAAPGDVTSNG